MIIPLLIAWYAWKARNAAKYQNKRITAFGTIAQVLRHLALIHQAFKVPASTWKGDKSLAGKLGLNFFTKPLNR